MPKCIIPPGQRPGFADLDGVAEPREMVGRREAARPGAHDEHALAGGRRLDRERPAFLRGPVAEKPLDGVDADGAVEVLAIAVVLARVIADAAVDGGQRIVLDQGEPGLAVAGPRAHGRATPGCSRRPGRHCCRAARGRHRSAARCAPGRCPSPASGRRAASCRRGGCAPFKASERLLMGRPPPSPSRHRRLEQRRSALM